jgi:hypothetical protein
MDELLVTLNFNTNTELKTSSFLIFYSSYLIFRRNNAVNHIHGSVALSGTEI